MNTVIRNECDIIDTMKFVIKGRKDWNEHVQRADEDRLIKLAHDETPGKKEDGYKVGKFLKKSRLNLYKYIKEEDKSNLNCLKQNH